jgi:glycosyltransferase involved in cell wall biosynthesis
MGDVKPGRRHRWLPSLRPRRGDPAAAAPPKPPQESPAGPPTTRQGTPVDSREEATGRYDLTSSDMRTTLRDVDRGTPESPGSTVVTDPPTWSRLPAPDRHGVLTGIDRRRTRQTVRRALGWHGKFVIAHLGTMGPRQDLESLAPALALLRESQPDTLICFLGDGCRRDALIEATADLSTVEIRDPVPEDHRFAVLLAADLLLLSERGTGTGSLLGEYLPSGRPVLAVLDPTGATAAEIEDSDSGMVIPFDAPLTFVKEVERLRADPDSRMRHGDAGMRYAERRATEQSV